MGWNLEIFTGGDYYKLYEIFDDEEESFLEYLRWENNVICPFCESPNPYRTSRGFKCSAKSCAKKFTVFTHTILDSSKGFWRERMIIIDLCLHPHPSTYYAKEELMSQKTAWYLIRKYKRAINPAIKEPVYQLQYLLRQKHIKVSRRYTVAKERSNGEKCAFMEVQSVAPLKAGNIPKPKANPLRLIS